MTTPAIQTSLPTETLPNGITTVGAGGGSPTNIGQLTNSSSTGSNNAQSTGSGYTSGQSTSDAANTSQSSAAGNTSSYSNSGSSSGSESYIPDYEPQLGFLQQYGNMAGNLANQQYDWASNQFLNNSDLTNQNVNSYLEQSDLASTGAQRDYANYNDMFNPAAGSLTADWQSYASPDRIAAEMGSAEAGAEHSFESQRQNAERDLQSYGLNPGDPRYQGAVAASRTAQAAAQAGAGNQARINTENTARNLRTQALQVASQLPGQTATEQNVALQGYTGAQNAGLSNTSLGALTMGTTPQYLNAGVANNKFQPLGTISQGGTQSTSGSTGSNTSQSTGDGYNTSQSTNVGANQNQSTSTGNNVSTSTSTPVLNTTPYTGFHYMAEGGAIPDGSGHGGGHVPAFMSPSGGAQTDDIPARIQQTGQEARLNADEFVIPQDVSRYLGQKFLQNLIKTSRAAMDDPNQSPAQATMSGGVQHHGTGGTPGNPQINGGPNTPQVSQPGNPQINGGPNLPAPAPTPAWNPLASQTTAQQALWRAPTQARAETGGGSGGDDNYEEGPDPDATGAPRPQTQPPAPTPQVSQPAPQVSQPAPQVSQPAPAQMQHTSSSQPGAIPTMSAYRAANPTAGIMSNGGNMGGRYGYGINGGPGTPAPGPSQVFKPQSSYYTPRVPATAMQSPGWSNVTAPPPNERAATEQRLNAGTKVSLPAPPSTPAPVTAAPLRPAPAPHTPATPLAPQLPPTVLPSGATTGGPPAVGAVGKGMNNDGRLHPMMPNDLEQLLKSGDQISQQNAALYAAHGIPMPGGVTLGNPNDPTSFAYSGYAS